jgi:hypothetical protein
MRNDPRCVVREPLGAPKLEQSIQLPRDVIDFYNCCGGIIFFSDSDYCIDIVKPDDFVKSNSIILGEDVEDDLSNNWFIIAKNKDQFIIIDLSDEKSGRCYDGFWDRYGLIGEMPVVAMSFTTFLNSFYENNGDYWYWLKEGFETLGDAYD